MTQLQSQPLTDSDEERMRDEELETINTVDLFQGVVLRKKRETRQWLERGT